LHDNIVPPSFDSEALGRLGPGGVYGPDSWKGRGSFNLAEK